MLDATLGGRLEAVGLDPSDFGDPAEAWTRLYARFGRRITLIDRYELEAAHRGCLPEELDAAERARLAREVLQVQFPGFQVIESAGRPREPIHVVGYDPSWATSFERWRAGLHASLGATAVRIDHVGSTAVPGLAAKPVVDIQVSMEDPEAEAAYVPAIEGLGLLLRSRDAEHRFFRPPAGRPRDVHVHVCAVGSDWEREHLLFRDFLKADAGACQAYARIKLSLAERYRDDRLAYTDAKTAFILDAMERAKAWAERTGWSLLSR